MKTVVAAFTLQLFIMFMIVTAFNLKEYRNGIDDWAKITAKQFRD